METWIKYMDYLILWATSQKSLDITPACAENVKPLTYREFVDMYYH